MNETTNCDQCPRTFKTVGNRSAESLRDYHVKHDHEEVQTTRKSITPRLGRKTDVEREREARRAAIQARSLASLLEQEGVPAEYHDAATRAFRALLFDAEHHYRMLTDDPAAADFQSAVWAVAQFVSD